MTPDPSDPRLAAELAHRAGLDTEVQNALLWSARGTGEPSEAPAVRWMRTTGENRRWLDDIVAAQGWPGIGRAGRSGARDAWLLAQHAHAQPAVQRRLLDALTASVATGDAEPWQLAYLEDRVRTRQGLPQRYGTQYRRRAHGSRNDIEPFPVEEPDLLEVRRAAMGLATTAHFLGRWSDLLPTLLDAMDVFRLAEQLALRSAEADPDVREQRDVVTR